MLKSRLFVLASPVLLSTALLTPSVAQAAEAISIPTPVTSHIRTLAASCAACHGTNGHSASTNISGLAGINSAYFNTQMLAFKSGERSATVMQHHAKGLNVDEINQLASYFSQQKRLMAISPKPQVLKADHE